MASAEFKKWVAGITVDFHKTSQDAEKSARKALTRNPQFSIFIIEEKEFFKVLETDLKRTFEGVDKLTIQKIFREIRIKFFKTLHNREKELKRSTKRTKDSPRIWEDYTKAWQDSIIKIKKRHTIKGERAAFIVTKYSAMVEIKKASLDKNGKIRGALIRIVKNTIEKAGLTVIEEELAALGGKGAGTGWQVGHGEFEGAGAGQVRAAMVQQAAEKSGLNYNKTEKEYMRSLFQTYNDNFEFEVDRDQLLDADGNVDLDYVPILSLQSTLTNQIDRKRESDALTAFATGLEEAATLEGSRSLQQALRDTILYNLTSKGSKKSFKITGGKPTKTVKTHSKGTARKTVKGKMPIGIQGVGMSIGKEGLKKIKPKKTRQTKRRSAGREPLALIARMNEQLPEAVRSNMGPPALENRSGRFASSVRLTDAAITPKGFPSFGYTYDLSPYQTFEVGHAQGTPERDPRKLINESIRQIAANYALGRFFTRRTG
jgi:hypothetical protein